MINLQKQHPKILVIGDLMVDHYIWGKCNRISPEAPVQVVNVKEESNRLGGACNVAANLIAFGAKVSLCGIIGKDEFGKWLISELHAQNIDITHIIPTPTRPTTQKSRILISNQQVLRVDREKGEDIDENLQEEILSSLKRKMRDFDAVILSDYAKGLLTPKLTKSIIKLARSEGKPILVDPKGNDYSKYQNATLLTPNKLEAQIATQIQINDDESLKQAMKKLQKECKLDICLVTLSEEGIAILDKKKLVKSPTIAKEVYDVTGAGDTVIAALAFGLSGGLNIYEACHFANAAAAVVIGKIGSASANFSEIVAFLHNGSYSTSKIISKDELAMLLPSLREKKIVFTNGCFDLLHAGHISYLQQARGLGDLLIVGLNSDSSVKRLKGENRPINNQNDRALMLCALECVDFVVIFDEDTPLELIKLIKPHTLVKGEDYKGKEVVGSQIAKEVILADFIKGKSSSLIIQKIAQKFGNKS
ncbi:D-glycero-beta-D-manno-heptose-7-phosphate kinase [Helicobacter sp. T3_23-1059]